MLLPRAVDIAVFSCESFTSPDNDDASLELPAVIPSNLGFRKKHATGAGIPVAQRLVIAWVKMRSPNTIRQVTSRSQIVMQDANMTCTVQEVIYREILVTFDT